MDTIPDAIQSNHGTDLKECLGGWISISDDIAQFTSKKRMAMHELTSVSTQHANICTQHANTSQTYGTVPRLGR